MRSDPSRLCAVLVSSCDAYSDAWQPFFALFFRYWKDCPFEVFLISNRERFDDPRVRSILIPEDRKWSGNMLAALDQVAAPYVLYLQEDYFLQAPVDSALIASWLERIREWNAASIRLVPVPSPDLPFPPDPRLGVISPGQPYRLSLQASLWDREILRSLIAEGESGWDMEERGTKRSESISQAFLSAKRRGAFPYFSQTAIKRGKWVPGAIRLCRKEGVPIDLSRRPVLSERRLIIGRIKGSLPAQKMKGLPVIGAFLRFLLDWVY